MNDTEHGLHVALSHLDAEMQAACDDGDVEELARHFVTLSELSRQLKDITRFVEETLVEVMPDEFVELPGLGVFQRRVGAARKNWDSESLFNTIRRESETWDEFADRIREAVPFTGSLGWRVTALKKWGIDPDEYAEKSPGRVSVQFHGEVSDG